MNYIILPIDISKKIDKLLSGQAEKTIVVSGCFDLIHVGHIGILKFAKEQGGRVIVLLRGDKSISTLKGSSRPIIQQNERIEILKSIKYIDEVIVFNELTPEKKLKEIKPDIYIKGSDQKENPYREREIVEANSGRMIFYDTKNFSSTTRIIDKINAPQRKVSKNKIIKMEEKTREQIIKELEKKCKIQEAYCPTKEERKAINICPGNTNTLPTSVILKKLFEVKYA